MSCACEVDTDWVVEEEAAINLCVYHDEMACGAMRNASGRESR